MERKEHYLMEHHHHPGILQYQHPQDYQLQLHVMLQDVKKLKLLKLEVVQQHAEQRI